MNELINDFSEFLASENQYLSQVKLFLVGIPEQVTRGEMNHVEFQHFLEKYEVQNAHFIYEKKRFMEKIADALQIKTNQVSFRMLVQLGYREFESIGRNALKLSNEIRMLLIKISIFMKNFSKLQKEFKRLNGFIYQHDYSHQGVAAEHSYRPGRNYYGEA